MIFYNFFEIHRSDDERKHVVRAEYIVFAHNGFIYDDEGGRFKDGAVVFDTSIGDYDGGSEVCEAFIEGVRSTYEVVPMTMTTSCALDEPEDIGAHHKEMLAELTDDLQKKDPK